MGEKVLVFNPRGKAFSEEGEILGFEPNNDDAGPSSFWVQMELGIKRRVNTAWLLSQPAGQPASQPQ